jgi:hypothetical protein
LVLRGREQPNALIRNALIRNALIRNALIRNALIRNELIEEPLLRVPDELSANRKFPADSYLQCGFKTATISQIRQTRIGTTSTNLPVIPAQFATLEIEQTSSKRTGNEKATATVAFCIPAGRF